MSAKVRMPAKRSKWGNRITTYNGDKYHSAAEAKQAMELDILLKAKKIVGWQPQVPMPINVNGHYICTLIIDFCVDEGGSRYFLETKGRETDVSKLKRKLLMACYPGIDYRINGVKQPMLKVALGSKS